MLARMPALEVVRARAAVARRDVATMIPEPLSATQDAEAGTERLAERVRNLTKQLHVQRDGGRRAPRKRNGGM